MPGLLLERQDPGSAGTPASPLRKEQTRSIHLAWPPCLPDGTSETKLPARPERSCSPAVGPPAGCPGLVPPRLGAYRWAVVSGSLCCPGSFPSPFQAGYTSLWSLRPPGGQGGAVTSPGYWEVGGHTPGSFLRAVSMVFLEGAAGRPGVAEPSVDGDSHPFPHWPGQPAPPCCKVGPPRCHVDCRLVDRTPGQPSAVTLTRARARGGGHLDCCPHQSGRIPALSLQSGGSGRPVSRVPAGA